MVTDLGLGELSLTCGVRKLHRGAQYETSMSCMGRFSLIGLAVQVGLTLHSWPGPGKCVCVCQVLVNGGNLILKAEKRFSFQVLVVNPLCKMESSFVTLHPRCNLAVSLVLSVCEWGHLQRTPRACFHLQGRQRTAAVQLARGWGGQSVTGEAEWVWGHNEGRSGEWGLA